MSKRANGPFTYPRVVTILMGILGVLLVAWAMRLENGQAKFDAAQSSLQVQVVDAKVSGAKIEGKVDKLESDVKSVDRKVENVDKKVEDVRKEIKEELKDLKHQNQTNFEKVLNQLEKAQERGRLK